MLTEIILSGIIDIEHMILLNIGNRKYINGKLIAL